MSKALKFAAVGVALTASAAVGAFVVMALPVGASSQSDHGVGAGDAATPKVSRSLPSRPEFPTNERGESFGSAQFLSDVADYPDLIQAVTSDGKTQGYVRKSDLLADVPVSLVQEQQDAKQPPLGRTIVLYSVDGVTKVGEYFIQPGQR